MIYDLVKLPIRKVSSELSTIVPCFTYANGMDDVHYFGREIELRELTHNLFKYKTIETNNMNAVERVFYTTEPIDLDKRWWTTDITIYPVFYKTYMYPVYKNIKAPVYRYLNGTVSVLEILGHDACQQTYYDKLFKQEYQIPTRETQLLTKLTPGNDSKTLRDIHNHEQNGFLGYSVIPTDLCGQVYLQDNVTTRQAGLCRKNTCGNGIYHALVDMSMVPFEITPEVMTSENNEMARWSLHELIQSVEESVYTDINIRLVYRSAHDVIAEVELYSKYIGLCVREVPGTDYMKKQYVDMLRKWANISLGSTPTTVEFIKTWSEEIYITVRLGSLVDRYYFDLASYSLANLSFVDIFG